MHSQCRLKNGDHPRYLRYAEKSFLIDALLFLSSSRIASILRNLPMVRRRPSDTKSDNRLSGQSFFVSSQNMSTASR